MGTRSLGAAANGPVVAVAAVAVSLGHEELPVPVHDCIVTVLYCTVLPVPVHDAVLVRAARVLQAAVVLCAVCWLPIPADAHVAVPSFGDERPSFLLRPELTLTGVEGAVLRGAMFVASVN